MSRTHILISSNKIRANHPYKKEDQKRCFLAMAIAEDILREIENPYYKRKYKDKYISYKNNTDAELKHSICNSIGIIIKRNTGYKPVFKDTVIKFYRKITSIIPLNQTCFHCLYTLIQSSFKFLTVLVKRSKNVFL